MTPLPRVVPPLLLLVALLFTGCASRAPGGKAAPDTTAADRQTEATAAADWKGLESVADADATADTVAVVQQPDREARRLPRDPDAPSPRSKTPGGEVDWHDALDIPTGFFLVWTRAQYARATQPGPGGIDLLQREYDRFNAIGATHLMAGLFNEETHVRAAERGELKPGIGVHFAAEFGRQSQAMVEDNRLPAGFQPKTADHVFASFPAETDLDNASVRERAHGILDDIAASIWSTYGRSGAVPFYYALDESWGFGKGANFERKQSALFEYYVDQIRQRDRDRPIAITNNLSLIERRQDARDRGPDAIAVVDSVFAGAMYHGWTLFLEDHYPFAAYHGDRSWVLKSYAGRYYTRRLMLDQVLHNRGLSRKVDRYAATDPPGPEPEWWKVIQLHRLEEVRPDGSTLLLYRRPTRYEYAMQAYIGLACGARGISSYCYAGTRLMGEYESLNGETIPSQRPLKPRDSNTTNYHGIISGAWLHPDDEAAIDEFRAPMSATMEGGVADYFPEGTTVEPYPGKHYPWDRVHDLYHDLHELLPVMRGLRYWWATDGLDRAYTDRAGSEGELVYERRPIRAWMEDRESVHDGLSLGQRFRLRAVTGEDEGPAGGDNRYASNMLVGMFDDPADRSVEYYFLVNLSPNTVQNDIVVDNDDETVATLEFAGTDDLEPEVVWLDRDRDTRTALSSVRRGGRVTVDIPLLPGDAKLIRVRSGR